MQKNTKTSKTLTGIITAAGVSVVSSSCLPAPLFSDTEAPEISEIEVRYASVDPLSGVQQEEGITFYATVSDETGIGNVFVQFPDISLFSRYAYDSAAPDTASASYTALQDVPYSLALMPESSYTSDIVVKESRYLTSLSDTAASELFSHYSPPISYAVTATDIYGNARMSETFAFEYTPATDTATDTGR